MCHGDMHHHGTIELKEDDCMQCHSAITEPMKDKSADDCLHCHTADIGRVSEKVRFPHEKHIEAGLECAMCHVGVEDAPHLDFAQSGKAVPKLGHDFCRTCHAGDVPDEEGTPPDGANCQFCHESF